MKDCMTKLLALLLAALLLGTAGLAEADGGVTIEGAMPGEESGLQLFAEDAPGALDLALEPEAANLAIAPEDLSPEVEVNAATPVTLGVGQKYTIDTKKLGKSLSFKSSKPKVAAVSTKGVVTAKAKGTAVITCLRGKKTAGTWKVTVKPAPKKVSLNVKALTLGKGEDVQLTATTTKGSVTELKWKSSKKAIVSVDKNGLVKGLKPGEATVSVTTHNGLKASVAVTVKAAPKKVTLSATSLELKPGAVKTLKVALPEGTASYAMTCTSSDEGVATVTGKGNVKVVANGEVAITVKAVADGEATITVTAFNGVSATCAVEVAESFSVPIDAEHFPDGQFRAVVGEYDADKDGLLSRQEANAVKKIEIRYNYDLLSLKGIEYFKALEELYCVSGSLEDVDVSQNGALRILDLDDTCVKALDVTHNPELVRLDLDVTGQLKIKLDVSKCRKLQVLSCEESGLTAVVIGGLPKLKTANFLWCDGIKKLDVSGCAKLKELTVPAGDDFGELDNLNIDGCVSLEKMHCVNNLLTELDVSHCPKLVECLQEGPAEQGDTWIRYEHGRNFLVVDKDIKLTPAPKA